MSQRLIGKFIIARIVSVCLVSTFSTIFSYGNTGPIEVKFHKEYPGDGGMKVCLWDTGHMTKMAAM